MIFKDVLGGFEVVMLGNHAQVWNLDDSDRQDGIKDAFALLRVCRQVYAETVALPYALNTFVAICRVLLSASSPTVLCRWNRHPLTFWLCTYQRL
jgi:hypothetical protein